MAAAFPYVEAAEKIDVWRGFASVLASVAATMTGLLAAVTALFYAVYQAPLMKHLHERKHDRRILFNLFGGVSLWLAALVCALVACVPSAESPVRAASMVSVGFSVSGVLAFGPIGFSFWHVLVNINAVGPTKHGHDWKTPTQLDKD